MIPPGRSPPWWRRCCSIPRITSTAEGRSSRDWTTWAARFAAGSGTPTGPDGAGVQEHADPASGPGLRDLRRCADRRHLSPGEPVEPELHHPGRRPGAGLLSHRRHPQGDRGGIHRPHGEGRGAAGVGLRACGRRRTSSRPPRPRCESRRSACAPRAYPATSTTSTASGSGRFMWCDFEWDTARFPDPPRLLKELHQQGFHVCLWENPYISTQSALYQELAAKGYLLRRPDGSVYESLLWSQRSERGMGLCAMIDFTNPEAVAWFRETHEKPPGTRGGYVQDRFCRRGPRGRPFP